MSSILPVSDFYSNLNDNLAHAARTIGNSKHRLAVFKAVYFGKKQIKTIKEIREKNGLRSVRILREGGRMTPCLLEKVVNRYKKRKKFASKYSIVISLVTNKRKLDNLPTKMKSSSGKNLMIKVEFPKLAQKARYISMEEIDSFSRAKDFSPSLIKTLPEKKIKSAFQKIIGEKGSFKDWAGEKSDLYTTQIFLKGIRIPAAIAFKGSGTKGKLVPAKMGKNGDQINRLFDEPAQLFIVVYPGQIDSSIISQMKAFAIANAHRGANIYYSVIDSNDLSKLISAYPGYF